MRIDTILLLLALAGCGGRDADGDGITEGDCDDGDASVSPQAAEVCDGKDNNCDAQVDEGWYADADGDGFGDRATPCDPASAAPAVTDTSDCNDADATAWPGHAEVCDDADNDCNGVADDAIAFLTWYEDGDGDGFGDPDLSVSVCAPPGEPYTTDGTDCDDSIATTYPGAMENCDGTDEDCDGLIEPGPPDHEPNGEFPEGETSWLNYEDLDGDGWGNPDVTIRWCGTRPGWSTFAELARDCDDTDPDVPYGSVEGIQPEECSDGKDNECDGLMDGDDPDCP